MAYSLPELRVEVHKLGNEFFAVTKEANGREVCTHRFEHNATGLTYLGPLWLLERGMLSPGEMRKVGASLIGRGSRGQIAQYGRRLYKYLFGNGKLLRKFILTNPAYQECQLTLAIHADAAALWRLPWEYMHDRADFVCLNGQMQIQRILQGMTPRTLPAFPLPLRALVVIASPHDQEPLDVEQELDVMMETLDDAVNTGLIQMDILSDATLPALQETLGQRAYHVLHYLGHGKYSHHQKGYLCFQDAAGNTAPVSALHLKPLLPASPSLGLVVLSACQSAQIGVLDAFDNVAAGLLQAGLPAVLAIPTSLQDESTIALVYALYSTLAQGGTVVESVHQARQALYDVDDNRALGQHCFDWGVPALYAHTSSLRLIDHTLAPLVTTPNIPDTLQKVAGEVMPPVFVGRRDELQTLRNALHSSTKALYVWGAAGIGKSTLVARLLTQLDVGVEQTMVIRCPEYPYPLSAIAAIADLWREHAGEAGHQAATLLLDARQDPTPRARRALQRLAQRRDLFIFDNFDAWFDVPENLDDYPDGSSTTRNLADATLHALLLGLSTAHTQTTLLFTGRQRWAGLEDLPSTERFELQVPLLKPTHAILLMNALSRLGKESLDDKQAILRLIGGHPYALRLLDGWLAGTCGLQDFLETPEAQARVAESWPYYFLDALLERLDPGEYEALRALVVWDAPFCADTVANITDVQNIYATSLLQSWETVALISSFRQNVAARDNIGEHWYTLSPIVREHVLEHIAPAAAQGLHAQIARYYGAPFVEEARQQVAKRAAVTWSEDRIHWLARSTNGILGMHIRQTRDFDSARQALRRALSWEYHLLAAGDAEAAVQIVKAISPVLEHWGQSDLAKSLLYSAIGALDGVQQAESLGDLAYLNLGTGHLNEAMDVYQSVYATLAESNARPQMGHILSRMAHVHQQQGDIAAAIEKHQAALAVLQEVNDEAGALACMRELTHLYRKNKQFALALKHSAMVKTTYHQCKNLAGLVAINHEQGLILKALHKWQSAVQCFHESMATARRIGDKLQVAANLEEIADVLQHIHQSDAAVKVLQEALKIYRELGNQWPRVVAILEVLGQIYAHYGQIELAQQIYKRAKKLKQRYQIL